MSTAVTTPKTAGARVIQALVLLALFGLLYGGKRVMPTGVSGGAPVAALGFLLVAGTLLSELVEVIKLPHLSGYLLAGIVAGPHVLSLMDEPTVQQLTSMNALALALISLEGGAQLKIAILREGLRSLAIATLFQTLPILVVMAASSSRRAHSCRSSSRSAPQRSWA